MLEKLCNLKRNQLKQKQIKSNIIIHFSLKFNINLSQPFTCDIYVRVVIVLTCAQLRLKGGY